MWPVPKNVSSASRSFSVATFFRRRVAVCPCRFVRFAAMNFFDRAFEVLQEFGPDRALRIRVGSGRERDLCGERTRDRASLPRWRAVDPGMLKENSMFRRPGPGPQMAKQRPLGTEELDRPGGRPREVLDATREGDEPGREDWTRDGGDIRCEFAGRSLRVRFDRFPLISDELREAGERLEFSFLPLREFRSDALAMIDWHLFSSPVHRHELDVRPGIDHWGELREVEPVPLSQPFDEDILFFLQLVEQERAGPRRQEEHRTGRNGSVRKSVSAYRDLARAFFFGATRGEGRSWDGFRIPCSVMIPVMYLAGVTSKDGLRAGLSFGAIG